MNHTESERKLNRADPLWGPRLKKTGPTRLIDISVQRSQILVAWISTKLDSFFSVAAFLCRLPLAVAALKILSPLQLSTEKSLFEKEWQVQYVFYCIKHRKNSRLLRSNHEVDDPPIWVTAGPKSDTLTIKRKTNTFGDLSSILANFGRPFGGGFPGLTRSAASLDFLSCLQYY